MSKINSITIATPMYGGQCHGTYHTSVMKFIQECLSRGIAVSLSQTVNESLIQRARDTLAAMFLDSNQGDVLLFIDSDIRFDAKKLLEMVLEDKDVIGALTPLKTINFGKIVSLCNEQRSLENAETLGSFYNFNGSITKEIEDAVVNGESFKVERIGTGVLSIKRSALVEMSKHVKEYVDDNPVAQTKKRYEFFPVEVVFDKDWNANRLMSEDYGFCNIWTKLGGEIWAKDGIVLGHSGAYEYKGNLPEEIKLIQSINLKRQNS